MLFYRPDSASIYLPTSLQSGQNECSRAGPTLESHHRREAQIQDHGRLGELRDHPGDLAALHLRHAPCPEALSFEALGPAVLPGHGRQRAAHDLLPLRVQRRPQARDAHPPLRRSSSHPCAKIPGTSCRSAPPTRSSAWPPSCCSWRREASRPIRRSTPASVPGRSVMMTSTPRSSRRRISSAWFMVHTSTLTPLACAARTKRGVTTGIPLCLREPAARRRPGARDAPDGACSRCRRPRSPTSKPPSRCGLPRSCGTASR